jgi:hypothetical protein
LIIAKLLLLSFSSTTGIDGSGGYITKRRRRRDSRRRVKLYVRSVFSHCIFHPPPPVVFLFSSLALMTDVDGGKDRL